MPIIRTSRVAGIFTALSLILLSGCTGSSGIPNAGISGPTGRSADAGNVREIAVRSVWKQDLKSQTRALVVQKLPLAKTAKFDGDCHYDGYYNADRDVTRVGVYGNVITYSDYGTVIKNGYYVIWEEPGDLKIDFPPNPWQLVDVEITDQLY
jgi:hypothetical protein